MHTLELNTVIIRWISVSDMENNVYLVTSRASGAQVLIDAADDVAAIEDLIAAGFAEGAEHVEPLTAVLTTHRHWDHVRALKEIAGLDPAPITIAGVNDADAIEEQSGAKISVRVEHLDVGEFDGFDLQALELRGHTPGSVAYVLRDEPDPHGPAGQTVIFSGDSLFPGGPGKTSGGDDFDSLMRDLQERVFDVFDDDTIVLPGHGASTTLGAERPHIQEWLERRW